MKAAAVDIGTNSVRLLVAEVEGGEGGPLLRTLHRRMVITRLGRGVDREGRLDPEAEERTLRVLREYRELLGAEGVRAVEAAATSAARDASNAAHFLERAEEVLGVRPRVISGEEEAVLSYLGATYDLGKPPESFGLILVVDIGGGSTEFILGRGKRVLEARSIDVGCVRMAERFLSSDPPLPAELQRMDEYLRAELSVLVEGMGHPRPGLAVGLAGTVTTLAGIRLGLSEYDGEAIHHTWLTRSQVEEEYQRLASLPLEGRKRYMRLEQDRADVIVGGCAVLNAVTTCFGLERILVSEKDILDGLVLRAAGTRCPERKGNEVS
ncbi:Ppx/GppA phosphatase family protein [Candidatus Solincola tengchongensis]|uniref:Ppx/GppA phosphatase family protein n=1 Tax=Candidatus Solincola tengchongensis TaxID=2900693 RepID=UPI00257ECA6D|nr:Ppx/GppA phosphatase family protein [Candidatus Solincola tengchongensis]